MKILNALFAAIIGTISLPVDAHHYYSRYPSQSSYYSNRYDERNDTTYPEYRSNNRDCPRHYYNNPQPRSAPKASTMGTQMPHVTFPRK